MGIAPGTRIGRYEIKELLGAGGMGEVYLALDTKLDRTVALKLLPAEVASDQKRMSRFAQEARAASTLNHPHIITIHEIEDEGERPFIATEFIDGETLRERAERGPLSLREALTICEQIASALAAAHAAGVVHRDIKPENVMLRRDGYAKVLDFGLAKFAERGRSSVDTEAATRALVNTDPGAVMGTVAYMSPEQARGLEVDARTDLWSLGCVLYELVAGRSPFQGETPTDTLLAVIDREPPPLRAFAADAPEALEWIVAKALTKDRDDRYQTAREMTTDLRRLKQRLEVDAEIERSAAPHLSGAPPMASAGEHATLTLAQTSASRTAEVGAASTVSSAEFVAGKIRTHRKGVLVAAAALLAAAVGAGALAWHKFYRGQPPAGAGRELKFTRLLTGVRGTLGSVSVSPDGKYVVYAVSDEGASSLWLRQVSQDTATPIVPAVEDAWFAGTTFSPDGELVYFVGGNTKTNTLGSLYQVPVIGGREPKKILDNVSGAVSFSPDGRQFAFGRFNWQTGETKLMTARADGGEEPRQVASRQGTKGWLVPHSVAWSPDGKRIAFVGASVPGGLSYSVLEAPAEGGEERLVTTHKWAGLTLHLRWLKDGTGLIVGAGEKSSDPPQLWHVSYPEGSVRRVTNDFNGYGSFGVAADSSTIVANVHDITSKVWVAAPGEDEGRARKISSGKQDAQDGLVWTPDGQRIVYAAMSGDNRDIWIMNADGTGAKALTSDAHTERWPGVSPDGRYITYMSDRPDNTPHIWRMGIDGGGPVQLTDAEDYLPAFSPDGNWIAFLSWRTGAPALWKVPAGGGAAVQISNLRADGPLSFSPDGKQILFAYYDEGTSPPRYRPALASSETGQLVRVIDSSPNAKWHAWSRDGREIIYVERRNDVDNVWSQPVAGGAPKQLTKFTSDSINSPAVSPDGKRLAVARTTVTNEIVMIKGFR